MTYDIERYSEEPVCETCELDDCECNEPDWAQVIADRQEARWGVACD